MQNIIECTNHPPADHDQLRTKREMVRLLANDATGEQLDAAMHACIDNRLDDAERRTILIQTIYRSWHERLGKSPRPAGANFAPTWEDVERMFLDILAIVGNPRSSPPEPPPQAASLDKKSDMAAPIRASFLDWSRRRPIK